MNHLERVIETWDKLPASVKIKLMEASPELYFRAAYLVRSEQVKSEKV